MYVTTGTEDFILHVAVPGNEALYELVIDKLTERPEIADVRTSIVYEHIVNTRITPVLGPAAECPPGDRKYLVSRGNALPGDTP